MPILYIIAGPNGAGKTTASYTLLPELLNIREFVNADEIARGISPFNPEGVALQAGRVMLNRVNELLEAGEDFAFETTLATRSFVSLICTAKQRGYNVRLIFLWLKDSSLAIERVRLRVSEGGHHIPRETILRRYNRGIKNLLNLYIREVNQFMIFDNSDGHPKPIVENDGINLEIRNTEKWEIINKIALNGNDASIG